jgi:hypothetical protein
MLPLADSLLLIVLIKTDEFVSVGRELVTQTNLATFCLQKIENSKEREGGIREREHKTNPSSVEDRAIRVEISARPLTTMMNKPTTERVAIGKLPIALT